MKYVHTNLIAKDCFALSAFYQKVFGCKPVKPKRDLSGDWLDQLTGLTGAHIIGEHLTLPGYPEGGPTLEIFSYAENIEGEKSINRCGFSHIAFQVDEVRTTAIQIIAEGGRVLGDLVTKDYGEMGIAEFIYAKDPEGNIIELQNWLKKPESE